MKYSENLIQNPGAESGLTNWTASGVTVVTDGTKCFSVSPGGTLSQASGYVAFTLQPAEFVAGISFNYISVVPKSITSIRAFFAISLKYLVESVEEEDIFVIPLDTETQDVTGWFTNTVSCATRSNAVLVGYDIMIYSDSTSPVIRIDNVSLVSALDGLAMHELDENPHQLPLAITVGPFGIKATKGEQVMFWLKDTGDAMYAGEISAAQITIGQLTNEQIDVSGLDLLDNTVFSSLASAMEDIDGVVTGQATLIQQNANAISTQATNLGVVSETVTMLDADITSVSNALTNYYSTTLQTADMISSQVSSVAGIVTNNYNKLTGDISSVATAVVNNHAAINLRADGIVSSVSAVSTTVTNNYNAITGEIDSITTDVLNAFSEISQLADDITLKVTMGQVVNYLSVNQSGVKIVASNIDLNGITRVNADLTLGSSSTSSTALRFGNGPLITGYYGGFESTLYISAAHIDFMGSGIDFTGCAITGLPAGSTTMKWA